MTRIAALSSVIVFGLAPLAAAAQAYPSKPIRLIVPFPPGGAVDTLGRALGIRLADQFDQSVVVDNRAGAGGAVGSLIAARAPADGYTLLMGSTTTISINQFLYSKLPYDPGRDFTPVSQLAFVPHMLVVNPAVPAKSLADFIALAKSRAGKIDYASAGNGTPHHIAVELFKQLTNTDLVHIPFKGTGPAVTELVSGRVSFMSVEMLAAKQMIAAGKLRPLAIATPKRNPGVPDVPTAAEAGLPGFEITSWYGVVAPAGTPKTVVDRLGAEIGKAVASPDFNARLSAFGATPVGSSPQAFAAFLAREREKWEKAVKASGARLD